MGPPESVTEGVRRRGQSRPQGPSCISVLDWSLVLSGKVPGVGRRFVVAGLGGLGSVVKEVHSSFSVQGL